MKKNSNNKALNKQSVILKKGGTITDKAKKTVAKKVSKVVTKKVKEEKKLPDHHFKLVKVKKGLAQLGLFAGEDIKKGELIIEYVGEILNAEQAEADSANQYLFEVNRNKTIDGSVKWNIARYCNHACGDDAPNAESEIKNKRVFIKAIKNIKEGEEITYDYGEEFYKEHIEPHGCQCVAKIHGYPKEEK
jgi:hypothetical protein